ncbi:hypothetical protein [Sphingomonas glaciei]|uniref:Uncharacterized protein n=1 Tax=Sphingomonas glaciei TaxID=2938948 RepID=A0ABY5MYZ5_9SPHN|nr:hypothetical protein [Sphingomonas glaciei]UUR07576.1 hypothetical protein M1K48_11620 [Sphingomonas glaciei]
MEDDPGHARAIREPAANLNKVTKVTGGGLSAAAAKLNKVTKVTGCRGAAAWRCKEKA